MLRKIGPVGPVAKDSMACVGSGMRYTGQACGGRAFSIHAASSFRTGSATTPVKVDITAIVRSRPLLTAV